MEKRREDAFDRWNWETNDDLDREEFETLDAALNALPDQDEEMVHAAKMLIYKGIKEDIESGMYHDQYPETLKENVKQLEKTAKKEWDKKFTI